MITPPFTVLVLKKSKKAVTIRVTTSMLMLFLALCGVFLTIAGFSGSYLVTKYGQSIKAASPVKIDNNMEVKRQIHEIAESAPVSEDNAQEILQDVALVQDNKGNLDINCTFSRTHTLHDLYFWVILNPRADMPTETVVYPRSPIFRGLPVDYRNGIHLDVSSENNITISLSELVSGTHITEIRLLAYTPDGAQMIDKLFSTQN